MLLVILHGYAPTSYHIHMYYILTHCLVYTIYRWYHCSLITMKNLPVKCWPFLKWFCTLGIMKCRSIVWRWWERGRGGYSTPCRRCSTVLLPFTGRGGWSSTYDITQREVLDTVCAYTPVVEPNMCRDWVQASLVPRRYHSFCYLQYKNHEGDSYILTLPRILSACTFCTMSPKSCGEGLRMRLIQCV